MTLDDFSVEGEDLAGVASRDTRLEELDREIIELQPLLSRLKSYVSRVCSNGKRRIYQGKINSYPL
ncbi:MAG: hypothetical protein ABSG05_01305 [Candidatus Pacearchaeota archaeon]|jgi:hypothetical protein